MAFNKNITDEQFSVLKQLIDSNNRSEYYEWISTNIETLPLLGC